jgi:FdhE protein
MTEDLLGHIDRLIQQRQTCKEALVSYRGLVSLTPGVEPQPKITLPEESLKGIKKDQGFPLFSGDDLPVDFRATSRLFSRFLDYLSTTGREDQEGLKMALEKSKQGTEWSHRLFRAVLKGDDKTLSSMGEEVGLDPVVLLFLAKMALKPSLQLIRNSLSEKIDKEGWNRGYCPLCGSQPEISYFNETGTRYLHCELCGEEWAYSRLKCPFCGNDDHHTLGYFQAEEEEGFRVDFCRKCHRYLKTIDKRVFEESAPMELENLATIHLDMLAGEHGFK